MAKHRWSGGAAPDEHRCERIKRFGERCGRWKMKGSRFCPTHGGRRARNDLRNAGVGIAHLPRFYRSRLTKTLLQAVEEALDLDRSEQLSLEEELAIAREHAGQAVAIWSSLVSRIECMEQNPPSEGASDAEIKKYGEQIMALRQGTLTAGAIMVEQFKSVSDLASSMARIDSLGKDKVNVQAVQGVVHQCTRIMYEVCGEENQGIAEKFEALIQKHILIPSDALGPSGTNITPDQDAIDMDDTIPKA